MKTPCVADLDTARELLEHGVVGERAQALVVLRRCAADRGCDDWQNCDSTVQGVWHGARPALARGPAQACAPRQD